MGLGSSFTNETTLATYNLLGIMGPGTIAWDVFTVLSACGGVIFDNLPLIFAVGVAIGMARAEKEVAALSAAVAFLVMHSAISAMIDLTGGVEQFIDGATASVLGITSLQMGAFGGIIVGLGTSALHNKFYRSSFPRRCRSSAARASCPSSPPSCSRSWASPCSSSGSPSRTVSTRWATPWRAPVLWACSCSA